MVSRDINKTVAEEFDTHGIEKGDIMYYSRIIPNCGIYDVTELKIRTVMPTYFVGSDSRTKQSFLFGYGKLNQIVFKNRKDALNVVKAAEKCKKKVSDERYYEEF